MKDLQFLQASDPFRRALNAIFALRPIRWSPESPATHVLSARQHLDRYGSSNEIAHLARAALELLTAVAKTLKQRAPVP